MIKKRNIKIIKTLLENYEYNRIQLVNNLKLLDLTHETATFLTNSNLYRIFKNDKSVNIDNKDELVDFLYNNYETQKEYNDLCKETYETDWKIYNFGLNLKNEKT